MVQFAQLASSTEQYNKLHNLLNTRRAELGEFGITISSSKRVMRSLPMDKNSLHATRHDIYEQFSQLRKNPAKPGSNNNACEPISNWYVICWHWTCWYDPTRNKCLGRVAPKVQQTLDKMAANIKWRKFFYEHIFDWLQVRQGNVFFSPKSPPPSYPRLKSIFNFGGGDMETLFSINSPTQIFFGGRGGDI